MLVVTTLIFSVSILNIFIAIISEAYAHETAQAERTLSKLRAGAIKSFLLRASVCPTLANCPRISKLLQFVALCGIVAAHAAAVFGTSVTPSLSVVMQTILILLANFAVFLDGTPRHKTATSDARVHFLWIVSAKDVEDEHPMVKTLAERLEQDRRDRKERERYYKRKRHTHLVQTIAKHVRDQHELHSEKHERLLERHVERLASKSSVGSDVFETPRTRADSLGSELSGFGANGPNPVSSLGAAVSTPADSGEVLLKMARLEKKIERILENQDTLLRGVHAGGMPEFLPQERFHMTDGRGRPVRPRAEDDMVDSRSILAECLTPRD
jgi:hypothetical protein